MFYYSLQVLKRQLVMGLKINAAFTCFDFWMLFFETSNMVISTSIKRNVVFLICQCHPSITILIGWHFVFHIDSNLWI